MAAGKPPFVRNPYNYDTTAASDESGLACKEPTRTKQSFKDECDINTIVERFNITGEIPATARTPLEGDYTNPMDFREAWDAIIAARHSFEELPAKLRTRFNHDPRQFVEFALDPENKDELKKWGMLKPENTVQDAPQSLQDEPEATKAPEPPKGDIKPKKGHGVT